MRWQLAIAAVLSVLVAGCGGDDRKSLSKGEYIQRGDAICRAGDAPIIKATKEFGDVGTRAPTGARLKALNDFTTDVLVPGLRGEIEKLRALSAPDGDEDRLDALYDAADDAIGEVESDPRLVLRVADPISRVREQARKYGFETCLLQTGSG